MARIGGRYWVEFFGDDTIDTLKPSRQRDFHAWLKGKGFSDGYVSRIVDIGRAAINRLHKEGELVSAPFIIGVQGNNPFDKEPLGRPLTIDEMAALFGAIREQHLLMFCLIAANARAAGCDPRPVTVPVRP